MQLNNLPARIQEAFAVNGPRNAIPVPSQASTTPGAASFNDGFPSTTMQPISSGGVPPSGKDMNGILYAITLIQQWQSGGGMFQYDNAWSSANGGYPRGALLLSADGSILWQNTSDGNTTNPDAADGTAANWIAVSGSGITSITGLTNANVTLTPDQWGRPVLAMSGALSGNVQIILPTIAGLRWTVVNNTSGAYTLTVKTAAGAGVAVNQSTAHGVYCDGTNIVQIGWKNGDAIDGSPIGQTTPALVKATTLISTGTTSLGATSATSLDNTPIGQTTPAAATFTSVTSSGPVNVNNANVSQFIASHGGAAKAVLGSDTSTGAYAGTLDNYPFKLLINSVVVGNLDSGGINVPVGQTTPAAIAGLTFKFMGGAWSAPAAGNGIGFGNSQFGLSLGGKGSSYDVTIYNGAGGVVAAVPTGTTRVVFNSAGDTGDDAVFGGAIAIGQATASQHAVRYDQTIGLGQTWQNMTASRASGTTYTNTGNKPIMVSVTVNAGQGVNISLAATVAGAAIATNEGYSPTGAIYLPLAFIVPPGATYSVTISGATLNNWSELR